MGEFIDAFKSEWDEFIDKETSEFFYWTEKGNRYQWTKPEIPVIEVEAEYGLPLSVGQEVLYWFEGDVKATMAVVSRLRIDDETEETLHDVFNKANSSKTVICISRDELTIPAASSEETRMLELEKLWANQLQIARSSEERQERLGKIRMIEEEVAGLHAVMTGRMHRPAGVLMKAASLRGGVSTLNLFEEKEEETHPWCSEKPSTLLVLEGTHMHHPLLLQARERRGGVEAKEKREELGREDIAFRADRVIDAMNDIKAATSAALSLKDGMDHEHDSVDEDIKGFVEMAVGVGLSARSVEMAMRRTAELRVNLQIRIEQRNLRFEELERVQRVELGRQRGVEALLREKESTVTSPRSLLRRKLVRTVHCGMRRQVDQGII